MMEQVLNTHRLDDSHVDMVNVQALLIKVQEILHTSMEPTACMKMEECNDQQSDISEEVALTIHKIGCKISCKCLDKEDVNATTLEVFKVVEKHPWEAKVALALSAFVVRYGEICLASHLHATNYNHLASVISLLKPLPDISEYEFLVTNLLQKLIDVVKIMIKLTQLQPQSNEIISYVPSAALFSIEIIVASAFETIALADHAAGYQFVRTATKTRKELFSLTQKVNKVMEQLQDCFSLYNEQRMYE